MSNALSTQSLRSNAPLGTLNRMSPTLALMWKQCADLTKSFVVLALASLVPFWFFAYEFRHDDEFVFAALTIAGMFTCGFALVACFESFVAESDRQTREFLRNLPVSSFQVGGVKLLAGALAVVLFFVTQIGFFQWSIEQVYQYWDEVAIVAVVVFASSSISCSFWSSSWMAVSSAFLLFIGLYLSCLWLGFFSWTEDFDYANHDRHVTLAVVLLSAVALAIWLPLGWLRRGPLFWKWIASAISIDHHEDDFFYASLPGRMGIPTPAWLALPGRDRFPALCWQSVRQQAMLPFLALMAVAVFAFLFWAVRYSMTKDEFVVDYRGMAGMMEVALLIVSMMTGYGFGSTALYRDKLNSNLSFFQQHQEHGRELLLARILFPLLLLLVTAVLCNVVVYLFTGCLVSVWLPLWSVRNRIGAGDHDECTRYVVVDGSDDSDETARACSTMDDCAAVLVAGNLFRIFAVPLWKMVCWMMGMMQTI